MEVEFVEAKKRLKKFISKLNEKVTNEKQNIETVYQEGLKEKAEIVTIYRTAFKTRMKCCAYSR